MLPTFIGIGVPKAGTTWLTQCLREHPDIYIPPSKETMFFSSSYSPDNIEEDYEVYFDEVTTQRAVGEYSVDYFTNPETPQRLQQHLPSVKLLISLRNPIDQIYSHYWHLSRQNFHSWNAKNRWSFEEALDVHRAGLYEPANYTKYLKHWLSFFKREQFHVVFYDDICTDPATVVSNLFEFLQVDSHFLPASLVQKNSNTRKGVSPKSPMMDKLHARLYEVLNQGIYMPLKRTIGIQRAAELKEKLQVRKVLQAAFYQDSYPEMNPQTRKALSEELEPQIQTLSNLLEQDLSHWLVV